MKAPEVASVFAIVYSVIAFGFTASFLVDWRALRGWWADKRLVWQLRAEWKRRKRAQLAASRALSPQRFVRTDWRKIRRLALWLGVGVGVVFMLAFAHGCGGRYPIDGAPAPVDAGLADAGAPSEMIGPGADGAPADAHEPQCADLSPGEEFYAADTGAQLAQLILNDQGCVKFCRNTAGGATCVSAQNTLVRCALCQGTAP